MKVSVPLTLSKEQQKALRREVAKQVLDMDEKFMMDSDASVLWTLHEVFGFGKDRLKMFYLANRKLHQELRERYEFDDSDTFWLYKHKLKEYGIDVEEWYKEL